MKYEHRILIGLTGAIGKMGADSQVITNKLAYQIGQEVGQELADRKLLPGNIDAPGLWNVLNKQLVIDKSAVINEFTDGLGRKQMEISISSCNICPKKVGKYPIPGTACPVGGIFRGAAQVTGKLEIKTSPDLVPGEICKITVRDILAR